MNSCLCRIFSAAVCQKCARHDYVYVMAERQQLLCRFSGATPDIENTELALGEKLEEFCGIGCLCCADICRVNLKVGP